LDKAVKQQQHQQEEQHKATEAERKKKNCENQKNQQKHIPIYSSVCVCAFVSVWVYDPPAESTLELQAIQISPESTQKNWLS